MPWHSSWGRRGLRWGFQIGVLLGLVAAVATMIDAVLNGNTQDALLQTITFLVASPFLGFVAGLFGYALGTLLEAILKSIAARPKGIDKALAAHGKEAGQTLAARRQARRMSADESFQPAPHVRPTPPPPEKDTGVFPEADGEKLE